jgi:hypothetical protein
MRPWYSFDQFDELAAGGEGLGRRLPGGRGHVRTPYQQFQFFAEARWGNRALSMLERGIMDWMAWMAWNNGSPESAESRARFSRDGRCEECFRLWPVGL